jgi:hypothetical protein
MISEKPGQGAGLDSAPAHQKVQDQRDEREYEQQVDQPTSHVEDRKSANPCDQQNDEQYCPDAHL